MITFAAGIINQFVLDQPDPDPYASLLAALNHPIFHDFSPASIIVLSVMLVLLFISALISGCETSYFSLKSNDINSLRESGNRKDRIILKMREQAKLLLATILIVNNLINVAIVILSTFVTASVFDTSDRLWLIIIIQIVVVTSLILLFGEIIPKVIAHQKPLILSRMMAKTMYFLMGLFKPLSMAFVSSSVYLDNRLARRTASIDMSELSAAIDISSDESTPPEEKKMLKGIATFSEKEVTAIMKSRVSITAIDIKSDLGTVLKTILNSGFSRIPVYEDSLDKVVGILYIKDLIPFLDKKSFDWKKLIRPAFYVPETKKINDLLQEFREKKIHLALVVDEYGGTSGMLTLEDIIEEIVGDISDEFDKDPESAGFKKIDDHTFVFEARTNLIDFCKITEIDDHYFEDVQGESDTLAGLLLELEGIIPVKGQKIVCKGFVFEVTDADSRRIKQVKATKQRYT
jgi:gliding motility-associated protein GldE